MQDDDSDVEREAKDPPAGVRALPSAPAPQPASSAPVTSRLALLKARLQADRDREQARNAARPQDRCIRIVNHCFATILPVLMVNTLRQAQQPPTQPLAGASLCLISSSLQLSSCEVQVRADTDRFVLSVS